MSGFYFYDLDGKKRTYSSVTAVQKGAKMFADKWGCAVDVFEEVGGFRKTTVKARKNPVVRREPSGMASALRIFQEHGGKVSKASKDALRSWLNRGATTFQAGMLTANDFPAKGKGVNPEFYNRNPAMLGGSVLSRSRSTLASGYLSLIKAARAKGNARLNKRPARSAEHRSRVSNANSVLRIVSFKQPVGGRLEEIAGLTDREAKSLADKLRNYGLKGVTVS